MGRFENVKVFEDTERRCAVGALRDAIVRSTASQELILEGDEIRLAHGTGENVRRAGRVVVSGKRTIEAAVAYRGKRVMVLNFASAGNPGGGVVRGSSAQEEALCRVTTLYASLNTRTMWDGFYGPHRAAHNPLHNDDIIYTPDVIAFKSDTDVPRPLDESRWFTLDVISCAAPNLRERPSNAMNGGDGDSAIVLTPGELEAIHVKRFTRILSVAAARGGEVLILGAFGCGAFRNDPKVVARAASKAIAPFRSAFDAIEFAVYCPPWGDNANYRAFAEIHW